MSSFSGSSVKAVGTDLSEAETLFFWPYRFFDVQHIQQEYNASHINSAATIRYDEDTNIFRMHCKRDHVDNHTEAFMTYVENYIKGELDKNATEFMTEDVPQVEKLKTGTNDRKRYFDLAEKDYLVELGASAGELIRSETFKQVISYSAHIPKSATINKGLFESVAKIYECSLNWLSYGLQVSSNEQTNLHIAIDILEPAVQLLEGFTVELYWLDEVLNSHLRFTKLSTVVDHSLYRISNFGTTHCAVHLVRWDQKSCQWVSVRPSRIEGCKWPQEVANTWKTPVSCHYGTSTTDPTRDANLQSLIQNLQPTPMAPDQVTSIKMWVTDIGPGLQDSTHSDEAPTDGISSTGAKDDQVKLLLEGKVLEKDEEDSITEEMRQTNIQERRRQFDDTIVGKPRVRPAPRLKTASKYSSTSRVSKTDELPEPRRDFVSVLVDHVAKLLCATTLYLQEASFLEVHIGQLFVSTMDIPEAYKPGIRKTGESFVPMDLQKMLCSEASMDKRDKTVFSRRLTSSVDDALYMTVTQLPSAKSSTKGNPVFKRKPVSDRTLYQLLCRNNTTGRIIILDIDQDKNTTMKAQRLETGTVNVHFPAQVWDARIESSVQIPLSDTEKQSLRKLLETIWIGSNSEKPTEDQKTTEDEKLFGRKDTDITIISCQRRRERVHRTTEDVPDNKAIYLHITRVEELRIFNIPSTPGAFCAYNGETISNGSIQSTNAGSSQTSWYEAYLHSESINSKLPGPTVSSPYAITSDPDPTFMSPEYTERLKKYLRNNVPSLFNAAHNLVTQWDIVGAEDRNQTPVRPSVNTGGNTPVVASAA